MWRHGKCWLAIPTHNFKLSPEVYMPAIMLWVHLSNWNYMIYWWKREKFILAMYSVSYKVSYKIVRMTCIIIRVRLGTPWLDLRMPIASLEAAQAGQLFVFPSGVQLSCKLLLLSPWGPDNQDFSDHEKVRFVLLFSSYSAVRNKISRKRTKWKGIRRIRYIFYIFWEEDKKN